MAAAFLYLFFCSARNRVRVRLRRLRQPRYLLGSIAGLLYFYTFVFRHAFDGSVHPSITPLSLIQRSREGFEIAGAFLLFIVATAAWVLPGVGQALEFSRSEVQFLFQAPLTRRQLLHYKILRGQVGALFGTAVATIFLRPRSMAAGWIFLLGTWLLLAISRLYLSGVVLRRQSLTRHGANAVRRQWLPLLLVGSAVLTLTVMVLADWRHLSSLATGEDVFRELGRLGTIPPARWILWPFRALVHLPLSTTAAAAGRAFLPVAVLLVLNYSWVLRGDMAFEEASAAAAERRALERTRESGVRRNVKLTPFELSISGRPEIAILWKNLILLGRYASARLLLRFVPLVIAAAALMSRRLSTGLAASIGMIAFIGAGLSVLLGPQTMRNDLRQDLASLGTLKTWPLRGATIIRGELLAPALVLTVVSWLFLAVATLFFSGHTSQRFNFASAVSAQKLPLALAAGLIAPALILFQLIVQNGLAIAFPAWVAVGASRARGIDAMGQRLLTMAVVVFAIAIALIPGTVLAGAAAYVLMAAAPSAAPLFILLPALILSGSVLVECWIAIELLAGVFERTDVTAIDSPD